MNNFVHVGMSYDMRHVQELSRYPTSPTPDNGAISTRRFWCAFGNWEDQYMKVSDYAGVTDEWKIKLAIARAKSMGFRRHDLEDAVQEMILVALSFHYDPARANGLAEEQSLSGLFDRRLKDLRRKEARASRDIEDVPIDERPDHSVTDLDLDIDVRLALDRLGEKHRNICIALYENRTLTEIAALAELNSYALTLEIGIIRAQLIAFGLEDYLLPSGCIADSEGLNVANNVTSPLGTIDDANALVKTVPTTPAKDDFIRVARPA